MLLRLEPLDALTGLDALEAPVVIADGRPMRLPIDAIDEDPSQPRSEFDPEALQQLADTVAQRGVRQPISVRPHPEQPGRWMLNFGARRLRASRLAGLTEIPAFIDTTADSYNQVIENEQREGLKPLELALFVQRRMALGDSQAEIARRLGKTRGYVTFICALVDAPDWLLELYRSNRCHGITELYELRKLHEARPEAVERWLAVRDHVGRADVQVLKDELNQVNSTSPLHTPVPPVSTSPPTDDECRPIPVLAVSSLKVVGVTQANAATSGPASKSIPALPCSVTLWARYGGADVTIDLGAVPEDAECVFVRKARGAERIAVPASRVQLLRITKASAV